MVDTRQGLVRRYGLAVIPSLQDVERWEDLTRDLVIDGMGLDEAAETAARELFVGYRMNRFAENVSLHSILPLDVVQIVPGSVRGPRDTPTILSKLNIDRDDRLSRSGTTT